MNELINIEYRTLNGALVSTCNARDLWQFVESKQEFANWIKNRINKYGFSQDVDFIVDKIINSHNQVVSCDYYLTLETAKEIAMIENNPKGREVRRYFIECERRLHEQVLSSIYKTDVDSTQGRVLSQNFASELLTIANAIRALVDKYASHATSEPAPNSLTCQHIVDCEQRMQPQLLKPTASPLAVTSQAPPCADSIFLIVLRESLESQPFTANKLYLIIVARQYPALTDAAVNLLGDVTTWSARKLGQILGRWSRSELSCYRVLNLGPSKNGVVWRLEQVS